MTKLEKKQKRKEKKMRRKNVWQQLNERIEKRMSE